MIQISLVNKPHIQIHFWKLESEKLIETLKSDTFFRVDLG